MNSIADTAGNATEQIKDTASRTAAFAKGSLLDFGTQALKLVNGLRAFEMRTADGLLDRVGLQRRESMMTPVLWFTAGALVAGTAAFMLSPMSGKALRKRIAKMLTDGLDEAKHLEHDVETKLGDVVADAKKSVITATHAVEEKASSVIGETNKRVNGPPADAHR